MQVYVAIWSCPYTKSRDRREDVRRYRIVCFRATESQYDALQRIAKMADEKNPPNDRLGIAGVVEAMVCFALEKIFEEKGRQKPRTVEDAKRLGLTVVRHRRKKD